MRGYVYGAVIALAILTGKVWLHKIDRLTDANLQLTEQVEQVQEKAAGYELLIQRLAEDLARERQSYAELHRTQTDLAIASNERTQLIRRLQRENQELKNWAVVELPDSVKCLRHRPALRTADDYTAWLSSSNGLPAACQ